MGGPPHQRLLLPHSTGRRPVTSEEREGGGGGERHQGPSQVSPSLPLPSFAITSRQSPVAKGEQQEERRELSCHHLPDHLSLRVHSTRASWSEMSTVICKLIVALL
jgi:hypothetical protein